jgi:hypothetical protein
LEWKKRSFVSPSRAMKPNPFSVRVLIVPVMMIEYIVIEEIRLIPRVHIIALLNINSQAHVQVRLVRIL